MMGINAVKGVEIGTGFQSIAQRGSTHGDELTPRASQRITPAVFLVESLPASRLRSPLRSSRPRAFARRDAPLICRASPLWWRPTAGTIPASAFVQHRLLKPCSLWCSWTTPCVTGPKTLTFACQRRRLQGECHRPAWGIFGAYFAYVGLFSPYLPLWLNARGFSPAEIGVLISPMQWARVIGPPAWGWLADHVRGPQGVARVIQIAAVAALLASLGLLTPLPFWPLFALFCVLSFSKRPSTDRRIARDAGQRRKSEAVRQDAGLGLYWFYCRGPQCRPMV